MEIKLTRRGLIRTVTYTLCALAVAVILAVTGWSKASALEKTKDNAAQRSAEALSEAVDSIDITLKKTLYAGSARQFSSLASKLWSDCAAAKTELGQLPVDAGELDNVNRFISQVGNYAVSLSKKRDLDEDLSDEERKQLETLRDYADKLKLSLDEFIVRCSDSGEWFCSMFDEVNDTGNEKSTGTLTDMSEDFTDYPTLIYDGPFSDHIYERTPRATEGMKKVTGRKALETAKRLSDDDDLTFAYTVQGTLPKYIFKAGNIETGVTVQGGMPAYMINSRDIGEETIGAAKAVENAKRYAAQAGFENMKETYYETDNGRCVVNLSLYENDVTIYPDLVKVSVALDNGEVIAFDASDYLMNHTKRDIPSPKKKSKEAEKIVSRVLEKQSVSLALIPTEGKSEKLCWEFLCFDGKQKVLVYVNAETLEEEEIFLLIENENGKLTV